MKSVLRQIIELFPGSTIAVYYDDKGLAIGIPTRVLDGGILILSNTEGVETNAIGICKIVAVTLTDNDSFFNTDGSLKIRFLPPPCPPPIGCEAEYEAAVRRILESKIPSEVTVNIIAGGNFLEPNPVTGTAYGIAVLGASTIVSTCSIQDIR